MQTEDRKKRALTVIGSLTICERNKETLTICSIDPLSSQLSPRKNDIVLLRIQNDSVWRATVFLFVTIELRTLLNDFDNHGRTIDPIA